MKKRGNRLLSLLVLSLTFSAALSARAAEPCDRKLAIYMGEVRKQIFEKGGLDAELMAVYTNKGEFVVGRWDKAANNTVSKNVFRTTDGRLVEADAKSIDGVFKFSEVQARPDLRERYLKWGLNSSVEKYSRFILKDGTSVEGYLLIPKGNELTIRVFDGTGGKLRTIPRASISEIHPRISDPVPAKAAPQIARLAEAIPPPPIRRLAVFKGQGTYKQGGTMMKDVPIPGQPVHMTVYYNPGDRAYAARAGRLFENVGVGELPRGRRYTFVMLEDGSMTFGEVNDGLEFGVKHLHLANGRGVLAAGEVSIDSAGNLLYNTESGTFTRMIQKEKIATKDQIVERMREVFKGESGVASVKYTDQIILPSGPVSLDEFRRICLAAEFLAMSDHKEYCKALH